MINVLNYIIKKTFSYLNTNYICLDISNLIILKIKF